MMASLSPALRRAVAVALLLLLVLGALGIIGLPVYLVRAYQADVAGTEQQITRLNRAGPVRERLLAAEQTLAGMSADRLLLRGSTPAVAAAQLQGDVTALALAMGAAVASVQILEAAPAPPYVDVGLRLTMTADISTLRDFLYALEVRDPMMLVRAFTIARNESGGEEPAPAGMETLNATLEVHGFMTAPAAAPPKTGPS
jgi:hypothetical protein